LLRRDSNVWQPVSAPLFRLLGLSLSGGTSADRSNAYVVSPTDGSMLQLAAGSWGYLPTHGSDLGCAQLVGMWGLPGVGSDVWAVGTTCAIAPAKSTISPCSMNTVSRLKPSISNASSAPPW